MDTATALKKALEGGARIAADMQQVTEVLPSGMFTLDWLLLHVGGVPVGRLVELFGPESAGKSLVAYRWIASAQRLFPDRLAAVWDTEASLSDAWSASWAARQGVDLSQLPIYADTELGVVFDQVKACVESQAYSILVIDSIADCYPTGMLAAAKPGTTKLKEWGAKRKVGQEAGAITEFLKWLTTAAKQTQTTVIFCNQMRANLSAVGKMWGAGDTTPGGKALRHDVALRLKLTRRGDIRTKAGRDNPVIGAESSAEVVKCKFAKRGGRTEVDTRGHLRILFDAADPLDESAEILHGAVLSGVVSKSGAWYEWEDLKFQGESAFLGAVLGLGRVDDLKARVAGHYLKQAQEAASGSE